MPSLVYYILYTLATLLGIFLAVHLIIWLLMIIFGLPVSMEKEYEKPSKFYSWLFNLGYWSLLSFARVKIHVSGMEMLPADSKFLFISNHRSKFDNMVHSLVMRKYPLAFISKKENFKIPIGRHFMNRCCYLCLDRGNRKQGVETISRAISLIQNGSTNVGVFPEGTRSKDLTLLEFHPGTFRIAKKAKCPIVVGVTQGTEKVHKNFPFKRTDVYFDIVKVVFPQDYEDISTVELAPKLRKSVEEKILENKD